MKCPVCGSLTSIVTDSRPKDTFIHRRRKCFDCGEKFSTQEKMIDDKPFSEYEKVEVLLREKEIFMLKMQEKFNAALDEVCKTFLKK
tara:strand:+ start:587 stop:847 length:261 start_codon:yes stop_codon:yes gene_type:complete